MPADPLPRILSTLHYPNRPRWAARVTMFDRDQMAGARLLARLVAAAPRHDVVVLNGSVGLRLGFVDLVAAGLIGRPRQGPRVFIIDATWQAGRTPAVRWLRRALIRALDSPRVTYGVLSSAEAQRFPRTWGVDPARVVFVPFCYTLSDAEMALPTADHGGVFAGGDSMRDYAPLLEAAPHLDAPVTIATRLLDGQALPPNVIAGPVTHERFVELMRTTRVTVVPMPADIERGAGQQTYLNAMVYRKVVVVTDSPGARDHIEPGCTGLIVPAGDMDAMTAALRWALDPANAADVARMGEQAREAALTRFGPEQFVDHLLAVADRLAAGDVPATAPILAPR